MALATTTAELRWFYYLFHELKIPLRSPMCLFVDNISALHMAANPIFYARTCHIEIDYHFIRELLARGIQRTQYISSHNQLADIFTKNLTRERFHSLTSKLNLYFVPFRLRGDEKNTTVQLAHAHTTNHDSCHDGRDFGKPISKLLPNHSLLLNYLL